MAEPLHARTARDGTRKYRDPATGIEYPSVTTITGSLSKDLVAWAAHETALATVDNFSRVRELVDDGTRDAAVDYIKSLSAARRARPADLGKLIHRIVESLAGDAPMPEITPEAAPYVHSFLAWVDDFAPDFVFNEAVVANPSVGYAGTLDAIVRLPHNRERVVVVDWKTGKRVYPEVALQLTAYRYAEEIWREQGKIAMPAVDGGAVLHLQPGGYEFRPVETNPAVFDYFRAIMRAHHWQRVYGKNVLGESIPTPASLAVSAP